MEISSVIAFTLWFKHQLQSDGSRQMYGRHGTVHSRIILGMQSDQLLCVFGLIAGDIDDNLVIDSKVVLSLCV